MSQPSNVGPSTSYSGVSDCAAEGCGRNCHDATDAVILRRISPKGKGMPFVGLCQEHYGRPPIRLKPEAQASLDAADQKEEAS